MIRRSTWFTLLAFVLIAALGYGAVAYKNHRAKTHASPTPTPNDVITFSDSDILGVEIQGQHQTLILRRKTAKSPWEVVQPALKGNEIPDQQRISTAIFNLTTLSAQNTVPAGTDLNALGLMQPNYVVTIHLANGKTWKAEIGKETPIGSGYYVRANGQLLVVEKYAVDSITSLMTKPPVATPIPTSTPTPTFTPTPVTNASPASPPTPTP